MIPAWLLVLLGTFVLLRYKVIIKVLHPRMTGQTLVTEDLPLPIEPMTVILSQCSKVVLSILGPAELNRSGVLIRLSTLLTTPATQLALLTTGKEAPMLKILVFPRIRLKVIPTVVKGPFVMNRLPKFPPFDGPTCLLTRATRLLR